MMFDRHITLGLALALLIACGDANMPALPTDGGSGEAVPGDPGSATDAGTDPGDAEVGSFDGTYSVPVNDPVLEPFASVPVVLDWREANGEYRLDYDFPTDLTGVSQRVSFEGSLTRDGTIQLSGDLGSASCESDTSGTSFMCTERFPQMAFDLERLQRDLERRGLPADEIARRIEVASVFRSDPIGILVFALD